MIGIIFICQLGMMECDTSNALEVMRVPERFENVVQCLISSQAYLANQAVLRGDIDKRSRFVIVCQSGAGNGPDQPVI